MGCGCCGREITTTGGCLVCNAYRLWCGTCGLNMCAVHAGDAWEAHQAGHQKGWGEPAQGGTQK